VVDNLLPDADRIKVRDYLDLPGWKFGWKSCGKTDKYMFWHKHYAGYTKKDGTDAYECGDELKKNSPFLFAFWQQLRAGIFFGRHDLFRCYANGQTYGSDPTLHVDDRSERSYTSIYYSCDQWFPNWAGETVIFNETKDDILCSIYPKPNRLAIFRGSMSHLARGVSRTCPDLRATLMFKTRYKPDDRPTPRDVPDQAV